MRTQIETATRSRTDLSGVLLLDKPVGPSSRDVLDSVAPRLGAGLVGHCGTLDPLASGLLVVLTGRARRLQDFFTGRRKRYRATIRFGAETETLDAETPEIATGGTPPPSDAAAREALLARFRGPIDQSPPAFSAVRIDGRRAHRIARGGSPVEPPPRRVVVDALELVSADGPDWTVDVRCAAGTYIRSLARDLGRAAGSGAYLRALRRTAGGSFDIAAAVAPEAASPAHVMTLATALAAEPRIDVDAATAVRLRDGVPVEAPRIVDDGSTWFAWCDGRPRFRLKAVRPGWARSDLMFDD
jgi:tRNA pseudouridine55 synthase